MSDDNGILIALLGVAASYLAFVAWFVPRVRTWKDPMQPDEPARLHYLSGAWRRHYLSLFDRLSPLCVLYWLMGIVHYTVMVPLTCIYWISAPILHGIDRLAMAVRRLRIKCGNAGCYKQVELPVHVCPKCDERHRDLRPGRHGLFQRRCTCESPLPSMLVCGRHSLKSLCPHCNQPLGWTFTQDLHIVLVAGPAAGKTSLLTGLFHALRQLQRDGLVRLNFNSPEHERAFETSLRAFQQGYVPDKTKATLPASFIVQVVNRAREIINIHVYDVAGEVYQDRESLQSHAYFSNADAVLFLVDPFSLREVQQQAGDRLDPYRDQVTACDEVPQHVYDRLLTVLRSFKESSSRLANLPVAVTLTKVDAFSLDLGIPAPPVSDDPSDSPEVRKWLEERGEGNLVRSLEHDFAHLAFFACSALGHLPEEERKTPFEPMGVIAPLEWLLSKAGYRLKTEERKEASRRPSSGRVRTASPGSDLVAGANLYAWAALAASLACWTLPGMTCKVTGAAVAGLLSVLAFIRSTRVLGQGAWVAGLAMVFALIGTGTLTAEEAVANHKAHVRETTLARVSQVVQGEDLFTARTLLVGLLAEDRHDATARSELARIESQLVLYLLGKGETSLQAGDFNIADRSFRAADRLRPSESAKSGMQRTLDARVMSLRRKAGQLVAAGELPDAESTLREGLYWQKDNEDVKKELADVLERRVAKALAEGEVHEREHRFKEARASYESALEVIADHPAVAEHLANLEDTITQSMLADANTLLEKRDYDGAEKTFKAVQERQGAQESAALGLEKVKHGRTCANIARGNAALQRKDYHSALLAFQAAQGLEPDNKEARKGVAVSKKGQHDDEVRKGWASLGREDFDSAKGHFETARTIIPKSPEANKGLVATENKRLHHEGYVDGRKVGKEIALQSDRPTSRENLGAAIRNTEWRVQQQETGIKDEPVPYRQGWKEGVDNAIRAEFISMLPPEPKPDPPSRPEVTSSDDGPVRMVYYVILCDGNTQEAQRAQSRAVRAGLPAEIFDSRQLPVTGPRATLVAIGDLGSAEASSDMLYKARRAGFPNAYQVSARQ